MWKISVLLLCVSSVVLAGHIRREREVDGTISVELHQQCLRNSDCVTENSFCGDSETCVCSKGHEEKDDECVEKPKLGSECDSDSDGACAGLDNSKCEDERCACVEGFVKSADSESCLALAKSAGDNCLVQEQCSAIPKASCQDGACVLPKVISGLNGACSTTEDCNSNQNLVCKEDICECSEGHVESEDESVCLKRATNLGDECSSEKQCAGLKATCRNAVCEAAAEETTATSEPDQPDMSATSENTTEENTCADGVCHCADDFVESEDKSECLEKADQVGDDCVADRQCAHMNGSVCRNETCVPPPAVLQKLQSSIEGEMSPIVSRSCSRAEDCNRIRNTICKENICECKYEFTVSPDLKRCLPRAKKEGEECEVEQQCSNVGGSRCVEGKCIKAPSVGERSKASLQSRSMTAVAIFLVGVFRFF